MTRLKDRVTALEVGPTPCVHFPVHTDVTEVACPPSMYDIVRRILTQQEVPVCEAVQLIIDYLDIEYVQGKSVPQTIQKRASK